MSDLSIGAYLGVVLGLLFIASIVLVLYYAEPNFPWHSYITLILGYFSAFGILLLVPIDIAVVVSDRRQETAGSYKDDTKVLATFYNIFFTAVLILGSFVLVFEEYYNTDGYFTIGGKLYSSFKRMCIDMAIPCVAGLIILGILLGQHVVSNNSDALKLAAVVVTNTVYELGLMFLLGYSLVEYPRSIWRKSSCEAYLTHIQMKAASQFKDISEAQLSISLVVSDVLKTKTQIGSYSDPKLTEAMDILISECPPEFKSDRLGKVAVNKSGQVTIDTLAALRTKLNQTKDLYKMAQAKVESTKLQAYNYEDIVEAKKAGNGIIHWSITGKDSSPQEYRWYFLFRPILLKIAALICALLSVLSFLGVICSMKGVSNNVSVYFLAVHNDSVEPAGIVLFILITLGYTVYITTWSIFQIKLGASMQLVHNRTTPEALSFNVRMIARLAAPLAFFYLGWISENGIRDGDFTHNDAPDTHEKLEVKHYNTTSKSYYYKNETVTVDNTIKMGSAFSRFYQLQNIKVVQEVFGTIFPIVLYIVLGLFLLNVFNRILVFMKMENYQFGAQFVTEEQLREGKRQLQRHKKNTERQYRRGQMMNFIQSLTSRGGNEEDSTVDKRGFFSRLFGFGAVNTKDNGNEEKASVREPAALNGMIEKKGNFTLGGGGWKEFYAEVRSPGFLHLYKDRRSADGTRHQEPSINSDPNGSVIDLRLILDFKVPDRKNKDNLELDLLTAEDAIKLKFKTLEDVDLWKQRLMEWKDFNSDYGMIYPRGVNDVERGSGEGLMMNRASSVSANAALSGGGSNAAQTKLDLDSIHVEEGSDEEDRGSKPLMKGKSNSSAPIKQVSKSVFGFGNKKKEAVVSESLGGSTTVHDGKPKTLEGWLEKKGHGAMSMGGEWQKRYLRIDEKTTSLVYAKSSDPNEKPGGVINLKLVSTITPYEKGTKSDYSRFNVDMGEKVYKFRASSEAEGRQWVEGLNEWKDYFLLSM